MLTFLPQRALIVRVRILMLKVTTVKGTRKKLQIYTFQTSNTKTLTGTILSISCEAIKTTARVATVCVRALSLRVTLIFTGTFI